MTRPDDHGEPALSSEHGVCSASPGTADAYDWGFCWKVWDALRNAAYNGINLDVALRDTALGDTPAHRNNGSWNDGVPIAPLTIQDEALNTP